MRSIARRVVPLVLPVAVVSFGALAARAQSKPVGAPAAASSGSSSGAAASSATVGGPAIAVASAAPSALPSKLDIKAGGLTADLAADRAVKTSKGAKVDQAKLAAAAAQVDAAWDAYLPRLTLLAKYTRLSPIDLPPFSIGGGPPIASPFPVILNNYYAQASLVVPLSDYVFKIYDAHQATLKSQEAVEWGAKVTLLQAATDARIAYYNWLRARGAVLVAQQAEAQSEAHLRDLKVQLSVQRATLADVYRVEAQVAAAHLVVIQAENLVIVSETQLRTLMHASDDESFSLGEDIEAELPISNYELKTLKATAFDKRPEVRAIDAQIASAESARSVTKVAMLPRLDAFGDLYYANPNPRFFGAPPAFHTTWDIGLQLSWSPNDYLIASDNVKVADATIEQLKDTKEQLDDALSLEVVSAFANVRSAEASVIATGAELRSAEEAYRVRLEQFELGTATSALLIDSETDLTRARLNHLNARVDLRIAHAQLRKATGDV